jgi:hypothetical protein
MVLVPDRDVAVIVLTNRNEGAPRLIALELARAAAAGGLTDDLEKSKSIVFLIRF